MQSFLAKLKNIPKHSWILLGIVLVGIFLRTYHFREWLQFSPDEARDAMVISDVIEGRNSLPLLGPIAGGTIFHLGPSFYYFEYLSALIFGNTPEKLAYPDLFFSLLSIPLFFLFLKKYFSSNGALALTFLLSISYFAVANSRFALNPNSIPFFMLLFLYSLLEMMEKKSDKRLAWAIMAGLALGIGVQLHTLLLLILPIVVLIIAVYFFWKKRLFWKNVAAIFLVAVFLNTPQIINEIKTNGENTKMFFLSSGGQVNRRDDMVSNVGQIFSCQAEYNFHMISSLENKEDCGNIFSATKASIKKFDGVPGNFSDRDFFILSLILAAFFSLGGYFLLGYYYRREKDEAKRNFLALVIVFNFIAILALIPVASHITLRYYIILAAVPFILLGLWGKFLQEYSPEVSRIITPIVVALFVISNFSVIIKASEPLHERRANNADNSVLGETELMANYINSRAGSGSLAYLAGEKVYVKRFLKPLSYLAQKTKLELISLDRTDIAKKNDTPLFYIANVGTKKYSPGENIDGYQIEDSRQFNSITIFVSKYCDGN